MAAIPSRASLSRERLELEDLRKDLQRSLSARNAARLSGDARGAGMHQAQASRAESRIVEIERRLRAQRVDQPNRRTKAPSRLRDYPARPLKNYAVHDRPDYPAPVKDTARPGGHSRPPTGHARPAASAGERARKTRLESARRKELLKTPLVRKARNRLIWLERRIEVQTKEHSNLAARARQLAKARRPIAARVAQNDARRTGDVLAKHKSERDTILQRHPVLREGSARITTVATPVSASYVAPGMPAATTGDRPLSPGYSPGLQPGTDPYRAASDVTETQPYVTDRTPVGARDEDEEEPGAGPPAAVEAGDESVTAAAGAGVPWYRRWAIPLLVMAGLAAGAVALGRGKKGGSSMGSTGTAVATRSNPCGCQARPAAVVRKNRRRKGRSHDRRCAS